MKALVLLIVLASCRHKEKTLDPMYCEGGVIDDKPQSGECAMFKPGNSKSGSPDTIVFSKRYMNTYVVKRVGKGKYDLFLDGAHAGTLEEQGSWIHAKFDDGEELRNMRSDAPGFLM